MSASPDAHHEPKTAAGGQQDAAPPSPAEAQLDAAPASTPTAPQRDRVSVDPLGATDRYRLSVPGDEASADEASS